MYAASLGRTGAATILLKKGAGVNASDKDGWTALCIASYAGHEEIAVMLLAAGAKVNARITQADASGSTALMLAALNGHAGIVKLLLRHGADVNARDKLGQSALTKALQYGHDEAAGTD